MTNSLLFPEEKVKHRHWSPLVALVLACASFVPARAAQPWASAVEPDWPSVAGTYPAVGSLQSQEEDAILHWLQDTRTRADVDRVEVESHPDLDCFLNAIRSSWGASAYPTTKALLKQAKEDVKPVVTALKASFGRPRPHVTDPTLTPALPDDGSLSFPSKHAAEGDLFAAILIQLDPGEGVSLAEEGKLIGDDRAMAGVHWPSDVLAGQRLGQIFAAYWLGLPENAQMIQDASAEWNNPKKAKGPGAVDARASLQVDRFR